MGLARLALKADELLDTVVFGDAVSEAAHQLRASSSNASSRCAQGLPCRRGGAGASLKFRLAVEPQAQNYITVRITPLKNDGDHSFGSRFGPLRNRPPVFWCHALESWRQDGENSERMAEK